MANKVDSLERQRSATHVAVRNQMLLMRELIEYADEDIIRDELKTFNNLHRDLISSNKTLHENLNKEDLVEDQTWCATTDDEILKFKRGIFDWLKLNHSQHDKITTDAKPILEDSNQQICRLLQRQGAPEIEIDPFDGNPLHYKFFLATFKEAVETKITDPRGRLTRLLMYLRGDAKELVKHCIHADDDGYETAMNLLQVNFGDPYQIYASFKKELLNLPTLKFGDAAAFRRYYGHLLRCKSSMTSSAYVTALDSPELIRSLQLKLPPSLQERWNRTASKYRRDHQGELAGYETFLEFVHQESTLANDPIYSKNAPSNASTTNNRTFTKSNPRIGSHVTDVKHSTCVLCNENHDLDNCAQYLQKDVDERKRFVFGKRLCFGCYGTSHNSRQCSNRRKCTVCNGSHPTGLHGSKVQSRNLSSVNNGDGQKLHGFSTTGIVETVSMCVIPVWVHHVNDPNRKIATYALLDSCSQGSFVQQDLLHQLDIIGTPTSITIKTLQGEENERCYSVNGLVVSSYQERTGIDVNLPRAFSRLEIPVELSEIPTRGDIKRWKHLDKINHLIPSNEETMSVTLLIGANCPKALEPLDVIRSHNGGPYAVKSILGWYVTGPLLPTYPRSTVACHRIMAEVKEVTIHEQLEAMYQMDFNEPQLQLKSPVTSVKGATLSVNDRKFLNIMENKATMESGHYVLPLPFASDHVNLVTNKEQAMTRARWLKRRFQKDNQFYEHYNSFMQEIISKGYAKPSLDVTDVNSWYIPHHGVYHPKKPNKIRVVFDCSAEWKGTSLNKQLLSGPDLTNLLIGVLIRFRMEPIAVMADIEKMFYQVKVPENQQRYLKFLWWRDGNLDRQPDTYQMTVHLFGGVSSPSCANFALRKTAEDNESRYGSTAADTLRRNFYVDDMLKSTANETKAVDLIRDVTSMCAAGGFRLTKFVSNSSEVLRSIKEDDRARGFKDLDFSMNVYPVERALGVCWSLEIDSLSFRIQLHDSPLTRRGILSSISSVYDPLDLASPFVLIGRRILQNLCRDKLGWDEPVSDEIRNAWQRWRTGLPTLEDLNIPRCFKSNEMNNSINASLHHFSDASNNGYGQATYLRLEDSSGHVTCNLVMGKSRVAPLKVVSIPRLELTAAVVSVKVANLLHQEFDIEISDEIFWTDSKVVLAYIRNEAKRFHTFVANRVQLIRDYSSLDQWRYVSTEHNPADDASRGLYVESLLKSKRWFNGPDFLRTYIKKPTDDEFTISNNDPELKKQLTTFVTKLVSDILLLFEQRYSSWEKLKKVVATILRWKPNSRSKLSNVENLQAAERAIIRMMQTKYFHDEIQDLSYCDQPRKRSHFLKKNSLYKLDPFIDDMGLIRVGGRLTNSTEPFEVKHPLILPKQSNLSVLLIRNAHERVQHLGRNITLNEIRNSGFWIVGVNTLTKSLISKCVTCRRKRGKLGQQKMADLPADRVIQSAPFTYTGVDLFGPFVIKNKRKLLKRYGILFTCCMSRAIHIETSESLETDSFILALRRFIARRGHVRLLRCDNGTNFVGARNELLSATKEMDPTKVKNFLLNHGTDWMHWKFNPPYASHMGGLWERQIRTVRSVLETLLKNHGDRLDDESFRTFMIEAESIVNSRPLSYETINDVTGPRPLTPNHLLTMKSRIIMPPPGEFTSSDLYARRRWRTVQYILNEFWSRWKSEYLSNLQSRQKWNGVSKNFKVNDVVLVLEMNGRLLV